MRAAVRVPQALRPTPSALKVRSSALARVALGSSAVGTLLFGVVTAKIAAVLIGPSGFGYLAIVQGLANGVTVVVGLELGSSLIRFLPGHLGATGLGEARAHLSVAFRLMVLASVCVGILGVLARDALGPLLFDRPDAATAFMLVVLAGIIYSWAMVLVSILAAVQAVRAVVLATILSAASTPVVSAVGYSLSGERATPTIALVSSGLSLIATALVAGRSLRLGILGVVRTRPSWSLTRTVLAFALPKLGGTLARTATLLAVPLMVQRALGYESAGEYRAAQTISLAFSTIIIVALSHDFFPRVSQARESSKSFCAVTRDELVMMSVLSNAFTVVAVLLAPMLVRVLYSASFEPIVGLLRTLLLAESLRVGASVLFLALNVSVGGPWIGLATLIGPLLMLSTLPWLIDQAGLGGVGVGTLGAQLVFGGTCGLILVAKTSFRLSPKVLVGLGLVSAVPIGAVVAASRVEAWGLALLACGLLAVLALAKATLLQRDEPDVSVRSAVVMRGR